MTPYTANTVVLWRRRLLFCCAIPVVLVAAACGVSSKTPSTEAPTTPVTESAPTSDPSANNSSSSTATPTVAAYPIVTAAGSLLRPPAIALTIPAEQDCHQLLTIPLATIGSCATATSTTGTITGTDEGIAHSQYWDVWKRDGNNADLVLTYSGNIQATPGFVFHSADLANDANRQLLAVEHTPGTESVSAVDIIETSGAVVAHIVVGTRGGVAGPAPGGGIQTWTVAGTSTATASAMVIRYTNGAWRTIAASSVSANQVPTYPNDDGFGGGLP